MDVLKYDLSDKSLNAIELLDMFAQTRDSLFQQFESLKKDVVSIWKENGSPTPGDILVQLTSRCEDEKRNVIDAEVSVALTWIATYDDPEFRMQNHHLIVQFYMLTGQIHLMDNLTDNVLAGLEGDGVVSEGVFIQ